MKNRVFVVTVSQHGSHGPWSMPVQISDSLLSAFETAKTIESGKGFKFGSIDDDVCIFLMNKDAAYCSCSENLIFVRRPTACRGLPMSASCYEEWWNVGLVKDELAKLIKSKTVQLPLGIVCGYHNSDTRAVEKLEDLARFC